MAGVKISALPAVASALITDFLPVVQGGVTSQETLLQIRTLYGFNSGTGLLAMANGGTNANLTAANGAVPYSTASAFALLAAGTSGQIFQSGGAGAPNWTTTTYPTTNAINTIMYASSANVLGVVTPVNSALLISSGAGVPSWSNSAIPAFTMAGAIAMGTNRITGLGDPVGVQDAATKNYVDNIATGGGAPVVAASTGALTVTQAGAGVGATLTNAGAQATFALDGQNPTVGQRVLIKNQAANTQNGVYTVTNVGSGATNWVLTRATDYDTPTDINDTGIIPVSAGTVNANTGWINTTLMVTVDTTAITFIQFGVSFPVSLANGGTNANLTASNGGIFYSTASAGAILAGTATAGLALLSGANTAPTWSTAPPITKVNVQVITSTATYTPTTGTKFLTVELVGPGAGGGGGAGVAATSSGMGGGGAAGGYCRKTYTIALLGANAAVVIGTGGAGGNAGNNNGSNGSGSSTFTPAGAGAVLTAGTGALGTGSAAVATSGSGGIGGSGGTASGGDLNITGGSGNRGVIVNGATGIAIGGDGGNSLICTVNFFTNAGTAGQNGNVYGCGGTGGFGQNTNAAGGNGANGVCYVTEYISI